MPKDGGPSTFGGLEQQSIVADHSEHLAVAEQPVLPEHLPGADATVSVELIDDVLDEAGIRRHVDASVQVSFAVLYGTQANAHARQLRQDGDVWASTVTESRHADASPRRSSSGYQRGRAQGQDGPTP